MNYEIKNENILYEKILNANLFAGLFEGVSKCTLFFVCKKIKQSLDFHKPRLCHVIKFL